MVDEQLTTLRRTRQLLTGGDVLSVGHAERFLDGAGAGCTLINAYGPTENTTFTTYHEMHGGERVVKSVPIGRPIANTRVYVLDRRMQPVVPGAVGELYIGGDGLARGYHDRAELTAERFVPDPFGEAAGGRLYRTGDLVRHQRNGDLEFIGRVDEQVKVRGFRIELGEIESRLKKHETVREAVVMVREERRGEKSLVAYVVAEQETLTDTGAWRGYLKEKLPDYMIPSAFVLLDEIPLTANGKVDRRALQSRTQGGPEREGDFIAPRDALETQLARIWEDLLDVRPVGVTDNFFDLGGHSLLAVRMEAHIRRELGRELPLALILQAQTIEELAGVLRQQSGARGPSPLVRMQTDGDRPPFFCVHPAGGNVACYSGLARYLGFDQPFYGLRASLLEGEAGGSVRLERMAAHYLEAVRSVQPAGPYMLGGWSMGGVVAFEMAQQLRRQGEQVDVLALIDSHAPNVASSSRERNEDDLLHQFTWYLGRLFGMEAWLMQNDIAESRGIEEQLRALLAEGARAGLVPTDLGMEQVTQLFQVFRMNVRAMLDYEPQPYAGRVTLLRASQQLADPPPPASNGWQELAAGGLEVHTVPGDHYTMMKEPQVHVLAGLLKACLERSPVNN
jgi:thioesterase domain-containing protein